MPADIYQKMVYSYKQPMWHAITEPSEFEMSALAVLENRFEGGFPVVLRPITVNLNDEQVETGDFAIVRGKARSNAKEIVFGYCSERYLPLQPFDIAKSFDDNVSEPVETMAFLNEGKEMFISWVLPSCEVATVTGLDLLKLYGIVRCGFDTLKGAGLFNAIYRPVCANTIALAQSWADANTNREEGTGNIWKGKGVNKNLIRDLGYWMKHVQGKARASADRLTQLFGVLAKTPIKNDVEAHEILYTAYPPVKSVAEFYPPELRAGKEEKTHEYNMSQEEMRDAIYGLFAGAGTAITPDYYGMMNATSEYFCHIQPSKRPIATSVMFGGRQKHIKRMVDVLAERI